MVRRYSRIIMLCARPDSQSARSHLLSLDWKASADLVLTDLARAHPDLRGLVDRLDVMRWGHAMVRPRPGFVWGGLALRPRGPTAASTSAIRTSAASGSSRKRFITVSAPRTRCSRYIGPLLDSARKGDDATEFFHTLTSGQPTSIYPTAHPAVLVHRVFDAHPFSSKGEHRIVSASSNSSLVLLFFAIRKGSQCAG